MYFVLELQVENGVGSVLPAITREERDAAEGEWHRIMSVAATSSVEHHGAVILAEDATPIMYGCYDHLPAPVPATEGGES